MKHISLFLIRAALLLPSIAAVHAQTIDSGVVDNRPFDARPFARMAGLPPPVPVPVTPADLPSVGLQIDWTTKETNELIVSLRNDVNGPLNALVAKTGPAGKAPGQVEDAAIAAINRQHGALTIPFGFVKYARRLMPGPRMSDNERATLARINPQVEALESFVVLRYGSILEAQLAVQTLKSQGIAKTAGINFVNDDPVSWAPNDPYFSAAAPVAGSNAAANKEQYQWGLYAMNFPAAWDMVRGSAYIGVYEPSWPGTMQLVNGIQTINVPDLVSNFRSQFSPGAPLSSSYGQNVYAPHSTHVSGIIAAQTNNGEYNTSGATPTAPKGGVAGACPTCSIATFAYADNGLFNPTGGGSATAAVQGPALRAAVDGGMQVINWSGSLPGPIPGTPYVGADGLTCSGLGDYTGGNDSFAPMCGVLGLMKQRDVLLVEAVGNFNSQTLREPLNMADRFPILPVGGVQPLNDSIGNETAVTRWYFGWYGGDDNGSNYASINGVVAPAKSIISTMTAGTAFNWLPFALCGDGYHSSDLADESSGRYANGLGDGYGSCTGTSMAAPHVTALAGLMRSLNPVVRAEGVRATIRRYSSMWASKTAEYGSGLPDAQLAVDSIKQSNSGPLIPLYSFYSADRSDSFYTTAPQMASAALAGTLYPATPGLPENKRYGSSYGGLLWSNPYYGSTYPGVGGISTPLPTERRAEVFVFNTHRYALNGTDWVDLSPLYRLSWACADPTNYYPTAVCQAHPAHNDVTYALESELSYFKWLGYKVDGIEGYAYPKTLPQPVGSTYLLRMYNPQRDDHAIFPYSQYAAMWAAGYTSMTNGVNFLGWVYENTNGMTPGVQ